MKVNSLKYPHINTSEYKSNGSMSSDELHERELDLVERITNVVQSYSELRNTTWSVTDCTDHRWKTITFYDVPVAINLDYTHRLISDVVSKMFDSEFYCANFYVNIRLENSNGESAGELDVEYNDNYKEMT